MQPDPKMLENEQAIEKAQTPQVIQQVFTARDFDIVKEVQRRYPDLMPAPETEDQKAEQANKRQQLQEKFNYYQIDNDMDIRVHIVKSAGDSGAAHHDFGELMIHQLIETIEFILGTVSNTASYLRLWALSLAHSELARVFWDNCLNPGFQSGSVISLYFGFFVFIIATIFVLMCMDLLECALHTLRLHWVEFQNKFFKGEGYSFNPMDFEKVFEEELD